MKPIFDQSFEIKSLDIVELENISKKRWLMQLHGRLWVAFHCYKQKLDHAIKNFGCNDWKKNIKPSSKWVYFSIYYKFTFSIDLTAIVRHFSSQYVQNNKDSGTDWFRLESNKEGTKWFGTCWCMHNLLKYEFKVEFDVSIFRNFCIGNEIRFQRQRILIFSPHGKNMQL